MKSYHSEYVRNRLATGVNFRLIHGTRRRIHHALKTEPKSSSTVNIIRIYIDTYRKGIDFQMTSEMNWLNIGIVHAKPISSFNGSKDEQLRESSIPKYTHP